MAAAGKGEGERNARVGWEATWGCLYRRERQVEPVRRWSFGGRNGVEERWRWRRRVRVRRWKKKGKGQLGWALGGLLRARVKEREKEEGS